MAPSWTPCLLVLAGVTVRYGTVFGCAVPRVVTRLVATIILAPAMFCPPPCSRLSTLMLVASAEAGCRRDLGRRRARASAAIWARLDLWAVGPSLIWTHPGCVLDPAVYAGPAVCARAWTLWLCWTLWQALL